MNTSFILSLPNSPCPKGTRALHSALKVSEISKSQNPRILRLSNKNSLSRLPKFVAGVVPKSNAV